MKKPQQKYERHWKRNKKIGNFDGIGEVLIFQTKENEEMKKHWSSPFLVFSSVLTIVPLQRAFSFRGVQVVY